jgi:hypothetical protein
MSFTSFNRKLQLAGFSWNIFLHEDEFQADLERLVAAMKKSTDNKDENVTIDERESTPTKSDSED